MRKKIQFSVFPVILIFLLTLNVHGQIPKTISFQGILTNTDGSLMQDGNVTLHFSLYAAETGGTAVWTETQQAALKKSIFSVILGKVNSLNIPFDKPYWVGIKVGDNAELTPRIALTSSPYSLGANISSANPPAGTGLEIKNNDGAVTHNLYANGNSAHTGTAVFGRIIIGDSTVVPVDSGLSITGKAKELKQINNAEGCGGSIGEQNIGVFGWGTAGTAVHGQSETGMGMYAYSVHGVGIHAWSNMNFGVEAHSNANIAISATANHSYAIKGYSYDGGGIWGESQHMYGVYGKSKSWPGVQGESEIFPGIRGFSKSDVGIYGSSEEKDGLVGKGPRWAGRFIGSMLVENLLEVDNIPNDQSLEKYLVWGSDKKVYYRTLPETNGTPFTGILNNIPLIVNDGAGNEKAKINTDGSAALSGKLNIPEVEVPFSTDGGKLFINGTGIKMSNASGASNYQVNPNGSSTQNGMATQNGGITVPFIPGGNLILDPAVGLNVHDPLGGSNFLLGPDGSTIQDGLATQNGGFTVPFSGGGSLQALINSNRLLINDAMGNPSHQFNTDGTSSESGLATFNGGSRCALDGGFWFNTYGPQVTLKNSTGTNVFSLSTAGAGTFNQGVIVPLINGNTASLIPGEGFCIKNSSGTYFIHNRYDGNAYFAGWVTKGGGSFMIDHPLDPANKTLSHSFVESPDMMNIYNGNVVLNTNGEATITLPDWFEALNKEFRYQLTCIGGFAQVYISEEIRNNSFKIAGGTAGLKVSWQVTGVRHDRYADANRLQVEQEKTGDERGKYLHPELYGQTISSNGN